MKNSSVQSTTPPAAGLAAHTPSHVLPDGKSERNDCTVIALAAVTGKPYAEVHAVLKSHGRRCRCAFRIKDKLVMIGRELGVELTQVRRSGTIGKLMAAHPSEVMICRVAGHMFATQPGEEINKPMRRIKGAWVVRAALNAAKEGSK